MRLPLAHSFVTRTAALCGRAPCGCVSFQRPSSRRSSRTAEENRFGTRATHLSSTEDHRRVGRASSRSLQLPECILPGLSLRLHVHDDQCMLVSSWGDENETSTAGSRPGRIHSKQVRNRSSDGHRKAKTLSTRQRRSLFCVFHQLKSSVFSWTSDRQKQHTPQTNAVCSAVSRGQSGKYSPLLRVTGRKPVLN